MYDLLGGDCNASRDINYLVQALILVANLVGIQSIVATGRLERVRGIPIHLTTDAVVRDTVDDGRGLLSSADDGTGEIRRNPPIHGTVERSFATLQFHFDLPCINVGDD